MKKDKVSSSDSAIRLLVNGKPVRVSDAEPTLNLLAFLRCNLQLTGTKEGCAEGDCGACTVVVGELLNEQLQLKTVNACIQFLPALDGKAVFTVEYLRQASGDLHPSQQAMVDCHGSQCGFCTPGFVMSLWNLYNTHQPQDTRPDDAALRSSLSGNLCRCTGYRPIIEAGLKMLDLPQVAFDKLAVVEQLQGIVRSESLVYEYNDMLFRAPKKLSELTQLRKESPEAVILAGCTDIGLWVNKKFATLPDILYVGELAELRTIEKGEQVLRIGAAVSLTDAYESLLEWYPELAQMHERFASLPIRNAGTLGGNVANGSPIGDSMPWLIAVGAQVVLADDTQQRSLLLEDYYLDYMKTALSKNEVLVAIEVPHPAPDQLFRTYKVSKRYDSDISAVCAAFSVQLKDDHVSNAVIAFGGMAAIPKRANQCEQSIIGKPWNESTMKVAQSALAQDYEPLSDMRASNDNRQLTAKNLLQRFYLETRSTQRIDKDKLSVFEMTL